MVTSGQNPVAQRRARFLDQLFGLEEQVALITGGRAGIGAELATGFARVGARIAITSRDLNGARRTAAAIAAEGHQAIGLRCDLESQADVANSIESVIKVFGRLDVLVNNAATTNTSASLEVEPQQWQYVVKTNLDASFFMAQAAARAMSEQGGGRIINLSSTYARAPVKARAAYAASKAAVEQLTRVLALEWAEHGIRVNAIAPTTVATEGRGSLLADPEFVERRTAEIPLGRIGAPSDLVATALLLAGPGGEFITGETIVCDGGFTLR